MKYVIALCLLLVSVPCSSMTFQRAKNLFSHLQNTSGYHVKLILDDALYINAWTSSPYAITITQGLLNSCDDAQLISVMGHEIGHINHQDYRKPEGSFFDEMNADVNGIVYCHKLGYSKKQCLSFLVKAQKMFGDGSDDGVHPNWSVRIKNAQKY